jgi:ubiquinone/menaquinone biosynthesis C-methylase UbiE
MGIKALLRRPLRTATGVRRRGQEPARAPSRRVDYEGGWGWYARNWSKNFPGRTHIGDEWNGSESGGGATPEEYDRMVEDKFIAPYIGEADTVLELGVGGGKTAAMLRAHAGNLICADIAQEMLDATRERLSDDTVSYVKLDGTSLDGIASGSVDVFFSFDTMVHIEPRDIFNYLTRIPPLMRGKRICVLHHSDVLSERGWKRFLREWEKNLMGRTGTAFSVMTDSIMQRFLDHLGYEVIEKDTTSVPRDCVWIARAPAG